LAKKWMENNLAEIRKSFGFSQEDLADRLGKDVSTISRWEREKSREPLISPLIHSANRKFQYIRNMIDPELIEHVEKQEGLCGLYYGSEFMIICLSRGNLKKYPFLRIAYGYNGASYFKGEGKRLQEENMHNLERALVTPGSFARCYVPGNSGIIVTDPLKMDFNFIGQSIISTISHVMTPDEAEKYTVAQIDYTFAE